MPAATKMLCCRLLLVFTPNFGIPAQKSRASPRTRNLPTSFTSSPMPACSTPVVLPPLNGLVPPNSSVEFWPKWLNPPPKLTQGETPCSGNRFKRAAGVTKIVE